MKMDDVIDQEHHRILKATVGNDDNDEVQQIGSIYGKDNHVHRMDYLIQEELAEEQVLLRTNPRKIGTKKAKKWNRNIE